MVVTPFVTQAFTEPCTGLNAPVAGCTASSNPATYHGEKIVQELNTSDNPQLKTGSLLIGESNGRLSKCNYTNNAFDPGKETYCSQLCINADATKGTTDTANCITAWTDLQSLAPGTYLSKFTAGQSNTSPPDQGYSRIQADSSLGQTISLIAEADGSATGRGIVGNGKSDTRYAGRFDGTIVVTGPGTYQGSICLNDVGGSGGSCIKTWADITNGTTAALVRLQTMNVYGHHAPDQGNVGANGPVQAGSLVVGTPTFTTSVTNSCGDGICEAANESISTCSLDCS